MQRGKRKKGQKNVMGNHQRCWVWGRNVVGEILVSDRWMPSELHLSEELPEKRLAEMQEVARKRDVPVLVEPAKRLFDLCHTKEHQGFLAKMPPFPYASAEEALSAPKNSASLYVLLDGVQDPYNFGAIVRSAEVLGVDAVFIPERGQAHVDSMVVRSSAGAITRVPVVRVDNLTALSDQLREQGVQLVCASEKSEIDCFDCDLTRPTALVMGNEGVGISEALLKKCDLHLRIPQQGEIGSLNVAMAASILFYETSRQRA